MAPNFPPGAPCGGERRGHPQRPHPLDQPGGHGLRQRHGRSPEHLELPGHGLYAQGHPLGGGACCCCNVAVVAVGAGKMTSVNGRKTTHVQTISRIWTHGGPTGQTLVHINQWCCHRRFPGGLDRRCSTGEAVVGSQSGLEAQRRCHWKSGCWSTFTRFVLGLQILLLVFKVDTQEFGYSPEDLARSNGHYHLLPVLSVFSVWNMAQTGHRTADVSANASQNPKWFRALQKQLARKKALCSRHQLNGNSGCRHCIAGINSPEHYGSIKWQCSNPPFSASIMLLCGRRRIPMSMSLVCHEPRPLMEALEVFSWGHKVSYKMRHVGTKAVDPWPSQSSTNSQRSMVVMNTSHPTSNPTVRFHWPSPSPSKPMVQGHRTPRRRRRLNGKPFSIWVWSTMSFFCERSRSMPGIGSPLQACRSSEGQTRSTLITGRFAAFLVPSDMPVGCGDMHQQDKGLHRSWWEAGNWNRSLTKAICFWMFVL